MGSSGASALPLFLPTPAVAWLPSGFHQSAGPTFLTLTTNFVKDNFSIDQDRSHGFGMIQVHFISWHFYF